jgi:hypothetical protein
MLKFELCLDHHNRHHLQLKAEATYGSHYGTYALLNTSLKWSCLYIDEHDITIIKEGTLQEVVNAAEAHYEENARNQPENH